MPDNLKLVRELITTAGTLPQLNGTALDKFKSYAHMILRNIKMDIPYCKEIENIDFYSHFYPISREKEIEIWKDGQTRLLGVLGNICEEMELFDKNKESIGSPKNSIHLTYSFWEIIHPKISKVSKSRFESSHYADSVEAAFKEVNSVVKAIVKRKTGNEFDGADLMRRAFSLRNPIIVLGDLTIKSGKDIQLGYMDIFAGAMTGIRNPKAHANLTIEEKLAVHFIHIASLLMYKIDEGKKKELRTDIRVEDKGL